MFKRITFFILTFTFMALFLTACGEEESLGFQATSTKTDVDIRSTYADDVVTFLIFNPGGIGDADISLVSGKMPGTIQIRLFVNGLENLELTYDSVKITASVPTAGGPVVERVSKDGVETEIDSSSPYWVSIQPLPEEPGGLFVGEPMLPASFLITLPADFYESGAEQFSLNWVDFYR